MKKVRIELQSISKSYYSETAVTQALRKVSLSFAKGEFVAITGESGSGKSTLLNIIGGMDSFDEGEMIVDGEPTFQYDDEDWETYRRTKIGYVFQDYSLIGHYTALDNVMSALLILGQSQEDARKTATEYLRQVGLDGYETHRASELSSGQKQRLSIARALAKNTGIIVADEPTGNLDSETGKQIIQLLEKLSKDRLVIMVTHNYDQAEAYVTRKIRLHDGQIISDVMVEKPTSEKKEGFRQDPETNDTISSPTADGEPSDQKEKTEKKPLTSNKIASIFARRNQKTQRGRALLFTCFLLVIAAASFLFIGELFVYRDDTNTKHYTQAAFYHEDNKRLIVKRQDGKDITDEDVEKLSSVRYVETVDSCDIANDINYFIEEDKDYEYTYGNEAARSHFDEDEGEIKRVSFLNEKRFMMSTDAITEEDLASGRLPQARNEIVLYAKDDSSLEKNILCYFAFHNVWAANYYYQTNVTVVGILKEPTEQVYFSRELCRMLSMSLADNNVFRIIYNDYPIIRHEITPVISDSLTGNEVRLSSMIADEYKIAGEFPCTIERFDEAGKPLENMETDTINIKNPESVDGLHDSTANLLEVSESFYNRHYKMTSSQASVYISSYAKTDAVLEKLDRLGYDGMSSYRISTLDYNEEKTTQRLTIIGISVLGLVILLIAEILILRSLMKIRIKDYFVLKFIGMKMQVIRRISYYEMLAYTAVAVIVTTVVMWGLRLAGIPVIQEIMWYYKISSWLLFILYNFLLTLLTVLFFNRLLKGRLNA